MKKVFSIFQKKSFIVFLSALLIGLWLGGFFEHYVFKFALVQNFSVTEAQRLNGKTVKESCYESQTEKEKRGKVVGYKSENHVFFSVSVKWDDSEEGFYTNYPKDYFSKCIEVIE
jgi:hypothetical protein